MSLLRKDLRAICTDGAAASVMVGIGENYFPAFVLAMQMAVQVSGPYFNPYVFVQLRLSYWGYVVLVCAAYVAKVALLPTLGGVAERLGPHRMLWISGLAIAPLPLLWTLSDDFTWLVLIQCYSGAVWAGHELAMLLLFFRGIPAEKRVAVLTVFNLASAAVYVAGSLVGGVLLSCLGTDRQGYSVLFAASTVARLASMLLLAPASWLSAAGLAAVLRPILGRAPAVPVLTFGAGLPTSFGAGLPTSFGAGLPTSPRIATEGLYAQGGLRRPAPNGRAQRSARAQQSSPADFGQILLASRIERT